MFAAVLDYKGKRKKGLDDDSFKKLLELEQKISILESSLEDKNETIKKWRFREYGGKTVNLLQFANE